MDGNDGADNFGSSVAISSNGQVVVVGGVFADGSRSRSGIVKVFRRNGNSYSQVGSDVEGEATSAEFGYSVDCSSDGSAIAVGARYHDFKRGRVRIFRLTGSSWSQLGSSIDGGALGDEFGTSVSLNSDGTTVAVGAPRVDPNASAGEVRVFRFTSGDWQQIGSGVTGNQGVLFGSSVALSGNGDRFIAASPRFSTTRGQVQCYGLDGDSWNQVGQDIDGEGQGDFAGTSVGISSNGQRIVVGAPQNDGAASNAGHARVFQLSGGTWNQLGDDIDGMSSGDNAGVAVSLSADGTSVAVGSERADENGSNSGHVRVFTYSSNTWQQQGLEIQGESSSDRSGTAVALSNADAVVIGAQLNDGTASNAGHARVFELSDN